MKTTDCGKRIITTCNKELGDKNVAYNVPMEFLNQFDIDEKDKRRAIEILATMPQNFTITKCMPGSTSPECSGESTTENDEESSTESPTGTSTSRSSSEDEE